jgi:hypothetical protein
LDAANVAIAAEGAADSVPVGTCESEQASGDANDLGSFLDGFTIDQVVHHLCSSITGVLSAVKENAGAFLDDSTQMTSRRLDVAISGGVHFTSSTLRQFQELGSFS